MIKDIKITGKQYVEADGMICPVCGSANMGYTHDATHSDSLRNFTCYSCRATWRDTYKLTGFTDLVLPEPKTYNDSGRTNVRKGKDNE